MLLIPGTGNGERGTGNGERGTGNGERGTGNWRTGNGEPGTGVWELVYSGNPLDNLISKWRTKEKNCGKERRLKDRSTRRETI